MCRGCKGWGTDFYSKDSLIGDTVRLYRCSFCYQHANSTDGIVHTNSTNKTITRTETKEILVANKEGESKIASYEIKVPCGLKCDGTHRIDKNPYLNDDGSEKYLLGISIPEYLGHLCTVV